jgi:hypothetical protein
MFVCPLPTVAQATKGALPSLKMDFAPLGEPAELSAALSSADYQFGVHLSHKITPLPPVENFPTVIGLSIVLSPLARRRLPTRSAALWPSLAAYILPQRA